MAVEVKIPELGESITEVVLTAWHKSSGDWVEKDEDIFEVESDKITTDIPAPEAGVLNISANEGDELEVGAVVATIDPDAEKPSDESGGSEDASAKKSKSESDDAEDDEEDADAATATATKRTDDGDRKAGKSSDRGAAGTRSGANGDVRATSVARRIADEQGIDLSGVSGSGPSGRITKSDVLKAAEQPKKDETPTKAQRDAKKPTTAPAPRREDDDRGTRREKMTKLRSRIAERLVYAKNSTAMLTTFNECDMSAVMASRKKYKESFQEKHGVGLGFMGFFVKAACSALKQFPRVNAYIVENEIEYHDFVDVSVAVSTEKGLTVPILRDADQLSFAEIESGIKDLATRARDGELTMDDLTGGTFTITNGGIFGSLQSTPILNPPQSAILGMHAIKNRPIEDPDNPGQIVLRPMMYLAVSYDHRIIDGAEAVQFLVHIKECIEDPERLLIGV